LTIAAHVFCAVTGGSAQHATSNCTGHGSDRSSCRTDHCTGNRAYAHARVLAQVATAAGIDVYVIVVVTHAVRGITTGCTQHATSHRADDSANRSCDRRTDNAAGDRSGAGTSGAAHRSVGIVRAFYAGGRHVLVRVVNDAIVYRISVI
jgi:hypothetical protein